MTNSDYTQRAITLAYFILEHNSTIRATAKHFNLAKSTVHHDLSIKLKNINHNLYKEVKNLLNFNFKNKHINGGEATKLKYLKLKKQINTNDKFDILYS